jgi:biopolymer transport protein ExbB
MQLIANIGFLFYPLCFFSLTAIVIIVERLIFFSRLKSPNSSVYAINIMALLQQNKEITKDLRDEVIVFKLLQIKEELEYGLNLLKIIAVLSPMIGLLGTVIGMIKAFKVISLQNSPVVPSLIADGLWNAMLTTAYGLIIAIPALFMTFIFLRISDKYLSKLQKIANLESFKIAKIKLDD